MLREIYLRNVTQQSHTSEKTCAPGVREHHQVRHTLKIHMPDFVDVVMTGCCAVRIEAFAVDSSGDVHPSHTAFQQCELTQKFHSDSLQGIHLLQHLNRPTLP